MQRNANFFETLWIANVFLALIGLFVSGCGAARTSSLGLTKTIALGENVRVETFPSERNDAYVRVRVLSDDLIHVESSAGKAPEARAAAELGTSAMVDPNANFPGPSAYSRADSETLVTLSTPKLKVALERATLCVTTYRLPSGLALARVCPESLQQPWKALTFYAPGARSAYGLGQHFQNPESADGDLLGRTLEPGPFGNELRGFSGGANSVVQIPLLHVIDTGGSGFGVFFDNVYKQRWDFTRTPWRVDTFGDVLRYFVSAKVDPRANRAAFLKLTGTPPVPPRKMFGLWVSEFGYDSWAEIDAKREGLARAAIPVDGFVLDLQWFGGEFFGPHARMGSLAFSPEGFPDPATNIARLRDAGVGLVTVEESYVDSRLPEHAVLAKKGYLVRQCAVCEPSFLTSNPWWGKGGMLDWSNPAAADFWHDWKRKPLLDLGILGHWTDLGEPEMYDPTGWYEGAGSEGLHSHADVHNLYALLWTEGIARGYRRDGQERRTFLLSRAGAAGIQRNGVAMWSGDIGANIGALKAQANAQMHMSFSGIDYYGSDAGGFHRFSLDGNLDALYTQWFAQSALFDLPLRPHAWNTDNTHETSPHNIGHVPSNRANAALRYLLFPYYYAAAHAAHDEGEPFVAPPAIWFPSDPELTGLGHEKMVGAQLLAGFVADYAGTQRAFYFPRAEWFDFRTGRKVPVSGAWQGEVPTVDEDGHLALPLFARAGAIIPMLDEPALGAPRDVHAAHGLVLRIFPRTEPGESAFTLVEDDGATTAYETGARATTRVVANTRESATAPGSGDAPPEVVSLSLEATSGRFDGMQPGRGVLVEVAQRGGTIVSGASLNGKHLPACGAKARRVLLGLEPDADAPLANANERRVARLISEAPCFLSKASGSKRFVPVWLGVRPRAEGTELALVWAPSETELARFRSDSTKRSVVFTCSNAGASHGESIYVTGDADALGGWDLAKAVRLEPVLTPHWAKLIPGFRTGTSVRWKCVRLDAKRTPLEWQSGPDITTLVGPGFFAQAAHALFR